jgi:hypothetical protein
MILKILQILKSFLKRFAEIISLHLTIFNSVLYSIVFTKEHILIFTKLIECRKLFEWVLFGIWRGHYWLRGVNFQRLLHACLILACVRLDSLLFNVHNLIIFKNCLFVLLNINNIWNLRFLILPTYYAILKRLPLFTHLRRKILLRIIKKSLSFLIKKLSLLDS